MTSVYQTPAAQGGLSDSLARTLLGCFSPAGRSGRLSIAIFHRVLAQPDPLFPGEVDAQEFDEICCWLSRWFTVLPLDEAADRQARGDLPARALVITFDDGYADNHDEALPILRHHGLCASFFVATGFLDGGVMWNDVVVESIRRTQCNELDLALLGVPQIGMVKLDSLEARRAAIPKILGALKYRPHAERQVLVQRVAEQAQVRVPRDLMMTSGQVRALAEAGMQIGAHTVSHPILARLEESEARHEIARSKSDLESLLGQTVSLFAYPNGKPGSDYLPRDVGLVRELGFQAAVSTAYGAARPGDAVFQLPRFTPWDRRRWAFGVRMLRNLASGAGAPA